VSLFNWEWVARNWTTILERTWEHIFLTTMAVVVGTVIAMGLAVLAVRRRRWYGPITSLTNILYTIPSLALFAFLVPFTGLSTLTSQIGLVGYTLLIIVRNTVAGIDGVAPGVKEAADGMGFTPRRRFWKAEFPLALPVIMAGIRIAAVTTVGLVTVTSILGQGGLGYFILAGLRSFSWTQIIIGTVGSVLLAVVIDVALLRVERWLTPWTSRVTA
jgi:osmoprotectant transport system permease protein